MPNMYFIMIEYKVNQKWDPGLVNFLSAQLAWKILALFFARYFTWGLTRFHLFGPILSIQQEECLQKRTDSRDVTYSAMPDTSPRKRPSSRGTLLEIERMYMLAIPNDSPEILITLLLLGRLCCASPPRPL